MQELSILEIIKYVGSYLISSKLFILLILELLVILTSIIFKKVMNKTLVTTVSIMASIIIFGFYVVNYIETIQTFINNVTMEILSIVYFPTTMQFICVLGFSFIIMIITLLTKNNKALKIINTVVPITISFLFLAIIEYMNTNGIAFEQYSIYTNATLMSLFEIAMGLFVAWLIGLAIYKVDVLIINYLTNKKEAETKIISATEVEIPVEEEIEMPKLKSNIKDVI